MAYTHIHIHIHADNIYTPYVLHTYAFMHTHTHTYIDALADYVKQEDCPLESLIMQVSACVYGVYRGRICGVYGGVYRCVVLSALRVLHNAGESTTLSSVYPVLSTIPYHIHTNNYVSMTILLFHMHFYMHEYIHA